MVEGGGTVHTQFLTADLADELQLVVAPFFVGDSRGPPVRRRRALPVEPGPARDARRGAPDRRRRAAALRPVVAVPEDRDRRSSVTPSPLPPSRASAPRCSCRCAFADGFETTARVFTFDGLADGREHLALGLGDRAPAGPGASAAPTPTRLHSECLTGDVFGSQRCDCGPQLREAVERIDAGRRLPALPAPGGPRHRPLRQARRLRAAGPRARHLRGEPRARLRRGRARLHRRRADARARSGSAGVALLSNNPDKAAPAAAGSGSRWPTGCPPGVHLSDCERPLPRHEGAARCAHPRPVRRRPVGLGLLTGHSGRFRLPNGSVALWPSQLFRRPPRGRVN